MQENEGATLIVTAKFSVASARSIVLQFEEVHLEICDLCSTPNSGKIHIVHHLCNH